MLQLIKRLFFGGEIGYYGKFSQWESIQSKICKSTHFTIYMLKSNIQQKRLKTNNRPWIAECVKSFLLVCPK